MQSGAQGVGLLRSGYMMLPGPHSGRAGAVFLLLLLSGRRKRLPGDRAHLRLWLRPHRGRCQSGAAVLQAWPARHPQQPAPAPAVPDPDLRFAARSCPRAAAGDVPHGDRCRGLGRRHEHCGTLPPEPAGAGRALQREHPVRRDAEHPRRLPDRGGLYSPRAAIFWSSAPTT